MSFGSARTTDTGVTITRGADAAASQFGSAIILAPVGGCGGIDGMDRVESPGYGIGALGDWWWQGFHALDGMSADGSEGIEAGDSNGNDFGLPPRNWVVPLQFGIDLKLAFPGGTAPAFAGGELTLDADANGTTYVAGITFAAPSGDPAGSARTNLDLFFQHNGFDFGSTYYFPAHVTLPAGLWNGPTSRLEFRIDATHVYAKLYDKAGADPGWQVIVDLTGVPGPSGNFDLAEIFTRVMPGPFIRWNGPLGSSGDAANHSALRFDNVTVDSDGCTDMPPSSCRDDLDRDTTGQMRGTWGQSPIRNLDWSFNEFNEFIYADGDDGVVKGQHAVTPANNSALINFGPNHELLGFPGFPNYFSHFNITGPNATAPFEVYMEFTPTMHPDPSSPGDNLYWSVGLEVSGGSTTSTLWLDNFSAGHPSGPGDVLEAYLQTSNGGGFPTLDPAGSAGDRIKCVLRVESGQALAKVWTGGSEPGGWDIVEALSLPFDFSGLRFTGMEFGWDDPLALAESFRLHAFEVRSGLGVACVFGG